MTILHVLGWVLAALAVGLWLGERGRRAAAERFLTYGSPESAAHRKPVSRVPGVEAEDRLAHSAMQVSEETVERVRDYLVEEARRQGVEGMTREQADHDARMMLAGHDVEMA